MLKIEVESHTDTVCTYKWSKGLYAFISSPQITIGSRSVYFDTLNGKILPSDKRNMVKYSQVRYSGVSRAKHLGKRDRNLYPVAEICTIMTYSVKVIRK